MTGLARGSERRVEEEDKGAAVDTIWDVRVSYVIIVVESDAIIVPSVLISARTSLPEGIVLLDVS